MKKLLDFLFRPELTHREVKAYEHAIDYLKSRT